MRKKLFQLKKASEEIFDGRIIIEGDKRVTVEDCKRVIAYSRELVKLRARVTLSVEGEGLDLVSFSNSNVAVLGTIRAIHFERT